MLLAILAAATVAAPPRPIVIQNPDWLKKPSWEQLRAAWPAEAWRRGVNGAAMVTCVVNVHGLLESCGVVSESPPGMGFGGAALLLTPTFLMKPATRDGVPFRSSVNIPLVFKNGEAGPDAFGTRLPHITERVGITHAVWRSAPTFADVARVYPGGGLSGHVVLRCTVAKSGALGDCDALSEEPPGKGFRRAAQSLIAGFRMAMDPALANSSERIYVSVPFRLVDPASDEFRAHRIGDPTWTVALDPARVAQVFPEAAAAKGVKTGRGVASCAVAADGSLTDCKAQPGQPDGLGFSEAAVVVASVMRMNIWTEEGGPVDGARIQLPIRFNLAAEAPAAPAAPAR